MRNMISRKGAFHELKLRALTLRNRQSETPRLKKEYEVLVQALCALQEISGCQDPEDQIRDKDVQNWLVELEAEYA